MNKILLTVVSLLAFSTIASADFARVEIGGGMWTQAPTGTMTQTDAVGTVTYTSDEKEEAGAYIWALVKHPIPIIPNLRVEYSQLKDSGKISGSVAGYTVTETQNANLDFVAYDVIPYYNILDNTFWISIDLGIDIKALEYVINYDIPNSVDDYIHRIGRTGRAGEIGNSISFVSSSEVYSLKVIEKKLQFKMTEVFEDGFGLDIKDDIKSPKIIIRKDEKIKTKGAYGTKKVEPKRKKLKGKRQGWNTLDNR
jgi:hypothetical protein